MNFSARTENNLDMTAIAENLDGSEVDDEREDESTHSDSPADDSDELTAADNESIVNSRSVDISLQQQDAINVINTAISNSNTSRERRESHCLSRGLANSAQPMIILHNIDAQHNRMSLPIECESSSRMQQRRLSSDRTERRMSAGNSSSDNGSRRPRSGTDNVASITPGSSRQRLSSEGGRGLLEINSEAKSKRRRISNGESAAYGKNFEQRRRLSDGKAGGINISNGGKKFKQRRRLSDDKSGDNISNGRPPKSDLYHRKRLSLDKQHVSQLSTARVLLQDVRSNDLFGSYATSSVGVSKHFNFFPSCFTICFVVIYYLIIDFILIFFCVLQK